MNEAARKSKIIAEFLSNPTTDAKMVEVNARKLVAKLDQKPMPGWKKKGYALGAGLVTIWLLVQYMHYETCREKYPQASSWVCVVSPK